MGCGRVGTGGTLSFPFQFCCPFEQSAFDGNYVLLLGRGGWGMGATGILPFRLDANRSQILNPFIQTMNWHEPIEK